MFGQKHNNTYCIDLSIISYYTVELFMSSRTVYIEILKQMLAPIAFYVWKPILATDLETHADYIHFRLLFNELTKEQSTLILEAGNLDFVYSIDLNVDVKGRKYLYIKTANLQQLLMLRDIYLEKQLEINIHLNYINEKINKMER